MSETNWLRFALFLAADHDGHIMTELRELAHGMEDPCATKQNMNAQLSKKKILWKAAQKAALGIKAPKTREEVNQKGNYIGKHEGPMNNSVA